MLYRAQQVGELAESGPYARIRHPQYVAFALIMLGFLLQWPTLLTLLMFPVLVLMYAHLARQEERWAQASFGARWHAYSSRVPAFFPNLSTLSASKEQQP